MQKDFVSVGCAQQFAPLQPLRAGNTQEKNAPPADGSAGGASGPARRPGGMPGA